MIKDWLLIIVTVTLFSCSNEPSSSQNSSAQAGNLEPMVEGMIYDKLPCSRPSVNPGEVSDLWEEPLVGVYIDMTESRWNALKNEVLDPNLDEEYTYFKGNVILNGKEFTNVGMKKRSRRGSFSNIKPALKIHSQKIEEDNPRMFGHKKLILLNNLQDNSLVGQCIVYDIYKDFGIETPKCTNAKVCVNGDLYGIYTLVEQIDDEYVERFFGADEDREFRGRLLKKRDGSDMSLEAISTFEVKEEKIDDPDDRITYSSLVTVLHSTDLTSLEKVASIREMTSIEKLFKIWSVQVYTLSLDSFTSGNSNYYLYEQEFDDTLHFLPWGIDQHIYNDENLFDLVDVYKNFRKDTTNELLNFLFDHQRDLFISVIEDFHQNIWKTQELVNKYKERLDIVRPHVYPQALPIMEHTINYRIEYLKDIDGLPASTHY